MAERQGGMRTPRNPAPVSGPGRLSRRTDGGPQQTLGDGMTGMPYGENAEFDAMSAAQPMSASGQTAARAGRNAPRQGGGGMGATPLFAPTQRPDEPVTAGAPFGPGEGSDVNPGAMGLRQQDSKMLSKYLPEMMTMADSPDVPEGFKRFVRHLRNMQGA